jgi:hypothetical protein
MSISTDVLETGGLDELASPVPFSALSLVIVTAIWSTYYLNKAMMLFRNSEVGLGCELVKSHWRGQAN